MQIRLAVALTLAVPGVAAAQGLEAVTPLYDMAKGWLSKSADMITDANWNFKPTPAIRSFGELIGHVADSNYMFCSIALGEKSPATAEFEKVKDRATVVKGLKDALAYCDKAYKIAPAKLSEQVTLPFGNMKGSRLWVLMFNVAHDNEHYGNLVTYFRLKNMVPPSSQSSGM